MRRRGTLGGFLSPMQFEAFNRGSDLDAQDSLHPIALKDGRIGFLYCDEPNAKTLGIGGCQVVVRGYGVLPKHDLACSYAELAEFAVQTYRAENALNLGACDGNFSVIVLDPVRQTLLAYRNIANNRFLYVAEPGDTQIVGSNLSTVLDCLGNTATPDENQLASYFLFRFSPAKQTLVKRVWRLLPGQELQLNPNGSTCKQLQTFEDLRQESAISHSQAVQQTGELFDRIHRDIRTVDPGAATLLSGGVDSCTLHAHWMNHANIPDGRAASLSITTDAPETQGDTQYALSAAKFFGTQHETIETSGQYAGYLTAGIHATGEPPNHVQGVFYRELAREMAARQITTGLNGEGADCLFGTPMTDVIRRAQSIGQLIPTNFLRRLLGNLAQTAGSPYWRQAFDLSTGINQLDSWSHPVNLGSVWTNLRSVEECFGKSAIDQAFAQRQELLNLYQVASDPLNQYHEQTMLGEVIDSATLWTGVFHEQGVDMICPFLDSRLLRFVLSLPRDVRFQYKEPKKVLKDALLQFMPRDMVFRQKLAFGQPIFQWMKPGGQLREMVESLSTADHPFVKPEVLAAEKNEPTWFLFSLLCYDIWRRRFIK